MPSRWSAPGRSLVFVLAASSIGCLLAEFYGLCTMRAFTLYVSAPAMAALGALGLADRRRGDAAPLGLGRPAGRRPGIGDAADALSARVRDPRRCAVRRRHAGGPPHLRHRPGPRRPRAVEGLGPAGATDRLSGLPPRGRE